MIQTINFLGLIGVCLLLEICLVSNATYCKTLDFHTKQDISVKKDCMLSISINVGEKKLRPQKNNKIKIVLKNTSSSTIYIDDSLSATFSLSKRDKETRMYSSVEEIFNSILSLSDMKLIQKNAKILSGETKSFEVDLNQIQWQSILSSTYSAKGKTLSSLPKGSYFFRVDMNHIVKSNEKCSTLSSDETLIELSND